MNSAAARSYYTLPVGLSLKGPAIPGVGNDVQQLKFSYAAGGSENWYQCFVKSFFCNCRPLRYKLNSYVCPKGCPRMFAAALFVIAYHRNNPDVYQLKKRHIHCGMVIQWNTMKKQK